ncbi:regulatory signaling modulator protein AmpE [Agaribacter flavus]|uniref:Regulatory signaling modulator protein AmpE n=1 Tax=Agaribacter flavus TaxID=1902781 RepID=A0ABV7FQ15_9ALTE
MTLFALLIVMALERVSKKSAMFHIATISQLYFKLWIDKGNLRDKPNYLWVVCIAAIPAILCFMLFAWLPLFFELLVSILILWVCLGCPVTRKTYRDYLAAANRGDFQACSLHSMNFGNQGGELDNVGKQLVLVNYRQYTSVILFFVVLGAPGLVFYSIVKELSIQCKEKHGRVEDETAADKILFVLDWLPVRFTTFGFLIVGHFTNALSAWLHIVLETKINTYDALAKVAVAAEDVSKCDKHLTEPLQLVKLVKRNVVFVLMAVAVATMVGLVR